MFSTICFPVQVISPVPQIEQFKLNSGWDFVVIATDGVWDAMANNDVLKYIKNRLENKNRSDIFYRVNMSSFVTCYTKSVETVLQNKIDSPTTKKNLRGIPL